MAAGQVPRRDATLRSAKDHIIASGHLFNGWWPKLFSRAVVEDAEKLAAKTNAMLGAA
jgi:hypothetical protein